MFQAMNQTIEPGKFFRLDCLIISVEINILILLNIVVSGDIFPV